MMQSTKRLKASNLMNISLAALLGLFSSAAMAQQSYGGQGQAQGQGQGYGAAQNASQPAPQNFDDETLKNVAAASAELNDIQREYASKLENVKDQEKAMELQKKTNEKMIEAVKSNGIEVATYNAVAQQMRDDAALRGKIEKMIEDL